MPSITCKDIGMDCKLQTTAPAKAELMLEIAYHTRSAHKIDPVPADIMARIQKVIKK
jgi:predicted small metal-binding protein